MQLAGRWYREQATIPTTTSLLYDFTSFRQEFADLTNVVPSIPMVTTTVDIIQGA
jgi:hypothetical protein